MTTDTIPIISRELPDGTLIEAIFDPSQSATALAVCSPSRTPTIVPYYDAPDGTRFTAYSATNNLLATGCVLLPSEIGELGDKGDLIEAIREYLDRYVVLSPAFMDIAPYYVMLSWVYDAFNELPYLRFQGDYGTGKTRALLAVGSICYKPFFASGASTVSPIFHVLDTFRGTLVLDEADFRFSEMTSELTKILNNGTTNGLPVLRTMTNRHRELNPQAFRVFGPKILAMRDGFSDRALESRFFTEQTGRRPLPPHIPIYTPTALSEEARMLRNRLLAWRLYNRASIEPVITRRLTKNDARLDQMGHALLSLVEAEEERARIVAHLTGEATRRKTEQRQTIEGRLVSTLVAGFEATTAPFVAIADIAARFNADSLDRFHPALSNKAIGVIVREKLGISTTKRHGIYVIEMEERDRVCELADRYGVPHTLPTTAHAPVEETAVAADFHTSFDSG